MSVSKISNAHEKQLHFAFDQSSFVIFWKMWENEICSGARAIREPLSKSVQLPAPPLCAAASQSFGKIQFRESSRFQTVCLLFVYKQFRESSFLQQFGDLLTVPFRKARLRPSTAQQVAIALVQSSNRQSSDNRRTFAIARKFRPLVEFKARLLVLQIDLETRTLLHRRTQPVQRPVWIIKIPVPSKILVSISKVSQTRLMYRFSSKEILKIIEIKKTLLGKLKFYKSLCVMWKYLLKINPYGESDQLIVHLSLAERSEAPCQ